MLPAAMASPESPDGFASSEANPETTTANDSESVPAATSAEPPAEAAAADVVPAVAAPPAKKKKKRERPVLAPLPDPEHWLPAGAPRLKSTWLAREQRITLQLLVVLVAVGLATWASGKLVYNEHPPEGDRYKPAELNVLANRPKNAAMEFHHSLCVLDFERATELAFPSALPLIEARRAACDAACLGTREKRVESSLTRATLLEAKGREATAEVECHSAGAVDRAKYTVRLEGPYWRVAEQLP
jgi:hypothetical protein